jgi:hypothetical protein
MFTVPAATPVIYPVAPRIVAMLVFPLIHVPPLVALVSVVAAPIHTSLSPPIGVAAVDTVTITD